MKVSALIITFNHGRFIEEAIQGFLRQETDFPCELLIADDGSTDETRDVIRRYGQEYGDRIRVLLNPSNLGARRTMIRAYHACRGQYVATSDGDDYWTSPDKLQRQAEMLDRHPEYALCFHSVRMVWDDGGREPMIFRPRRIKEAYTLKNLFDHNFIASCSPMYRRGLFDRHPAWCFDVPVYDWMQHVLHAQYGTIGYIDEPMAVYRQHGGGVYSMSGAVERLDVAIEMLKRFRPAFARKYRRAIDTSLCKHYCTLTHQYCDEGRLAEARRCIRQCLRAVRVLPLIPVGGLLKATVRAYAPGLHRRCKWILVKSQCLPAASGRGRADPH